MELGVVPSTDADAAQIASDEWLLSGLNLPVAADIMKLKACWTGSQVHAV